MADQWDVVVVGAGAAGLMAAARAAECGARVLLLEKNRQAGAKILMSGGTRCNLTQATDTRGIIDAFGDQGSFLHSALAALSPDDLVDLVEAEGVATKTEPTGKIFPASDRAADVLDALLGRLDRSGAELASEEPVERLESRPPQWTLTTSRRTVHTRHVIVTTGGKSFPGCGTTGDGYRWLESLGHHIVRPRPALAPITVRADWVKSLRGVTIADVGVEVVCRPASPQSEKTAAPRATGEVIASRRGSVLFAHFGLSGPAILDVSRAVELHARPSSLALRCDFLPQLTEEAVDEQFQRASLESGKRRLASLLSTQIPRRLVDALFALADLPAERRAAELSRAERAVLVTAVKRTEIPVTGTMGFAKAEVTTGGVSLSEVDSRTMQSKVAPGLFLAGEILDLDGPIGGYNFQAAFSTGWLAGVAAAAAALV
ncbi:MAG: NAD(P)/FAD-dependent oxidoreductase [Pirellulaceae bacterium]|nr:NAD(P)/FAD-dependent oxidoreductase [Pirellulaceae bacterium]